MDRERLLARRAFYVSRLKEVEEDIALYGNGTFKMQKQVRNGPWVDVTGQMLDQSLRSKKTYEDIIADIDERLAELDAG